ncbi:hypothetical protein AVO45_00825 [Ruegeria marisrubri]|uniref:Uncharacterized protein n=1 Tax=Ruegeria marisrubri TaxID=1685379 RepID=A0A101CYK1_9RHOB|nr:hypothetical protein AVO45_00825 [Ruegeria marisrubri]
MYRIFTMTFENEYLSSFLSDEQIVALPDQGAGQTWAFEPFLRLRHKSTQAKLDLALDDFAWLGKQAINVNAVRTSKSGSWRAVASSWLTCLGHTSSATACQLA